MVLKGINGLYVMKQTDGFLLEGSEKFGMIHALFLPEFMRSTDKTFKPLLLNHHKGS
jgi:hypothetical protein